MRPTREHNPSRATSTPGRFPATMSTSVCAARPSAERLPAAAGGSHHHGRAVAASKRDRARLTGWSPTPASGHTHTQRGEATMPAPPKGRGVNNCTRALAKTQQCRCQQGLQLQRTLRRNPSGEGTGTRPPRNESTGRPLCFV